MNFVIDDVRFPLVLIHYPEQASDEGIAQYGQQLEKVMGRGKLATVVDLRKVSVIPAGARQRRFLAEQVDAATLAHPGALIAEAVIFNSKLLKAAYTAFQWMRKDKSYPSQAFTEPEPAQRWAETRLREAGIL